MTARAIWAFAIALVRLANDGLLIFRFLQTTGLVTLLLMRVWPKVRRFFRSLWMKGQVLWSRFSPTLRPT